eukprot:scaffold210877_cov18-Tisochrysis_lutea.AAC.1
MNYPIQPLALSGSWPEFGALDQPPSVAIAAALVGYGNSSSEKGQREATKWTTSASAGTGKLPWSAWNRHQKYACLPGMNRSGGKRSYLELGMPLERTVQRVTLTLRTH